MIDEENPIRYTSESPFVVCIGQWSRVDASEWFILESRAGPIHRC